PDLGLHLAGVGADLREDRYSLLELGHGLLRSPSRVEEIGQGVAQRRLAVAVALSLVDRDGRLGQLQRALYLTRAAVRQRQVVERRGARAVVAKALRQGQAALEVRASGGDVAAVAREDAQDVMGFDQRAGVGGSFGQLQRAAGQLLRPRGLAAA